MFENSHFPLILRNVARQERIRCNRPARQFEVLYVMALFIKKGFIAVNVDLNLEGRHERKGGWENEPVVSRNALILSRPT